jgi:putative tryptophan/tyrosine transport system substrate-binding protein
MTRRDVITLLGGAAALWPLSAWAQPTKPVIGYLSGRSPSNSADIIAAVRKGLNETGFIEGQSVTIESRFAEGNFDRLPALAADLVARKVRSRSSKPNQSYQGRSRWFSQWAAMRSNSA